MLITNQIKKRLKYLRLFLIINNHNLNSMEDFINSNSEDKYYKENSENSENNENSEEVEDNDENISDKSKNEKKFIEDSTIIKEKKIKEKINDLKIKILQELENNNYFKSFEEFKLLQLELEKLQILKDLLSNISLRDKKKRQELYPLIYSAIKSNKDLEKIVKNINISILTKEDLIKYEVSLEINKCILNTSEILLLNYIKQLITKTKYTEYNQYINTQEEKIIEDPKIIKEKKIKEKINDLKAKILKELENNDYFKSFEKFKLLQLELEKLQILKDLLPNISLRDKKKRQELYHLIYSAIKSNKDLEKIVKNKNISILTKEDLIKYEVSLEINKCILNTSEIFLLKYMEKLITKTKYNQYFKYKNTKKEKKILINKEKEKDQKVEKEFKNSENEEEYSNQSKKKNNHDQYESPKYYLDENSFYNYFNHPEVDNDNDELFYLNPENN